MESWTPQSPPPSLKFEDSPADSFLSASSDLYSPLYDTTETSTMNPLEIISQSFEEDSKPERDSRSRTGTASASMSPTPDPSSAATTEKKPAKKRKSWGQVLPEPKTSLPPRKRAKTEDEKEQRRVERVLRNRRAAQSSRERKRQEVELLEQRNKELEAALRQSQQTNIALMEALQKLQRSSGVASSLRPTGGVTLSQELFSSHDGHSAALLDQDHSLDELIMSVPASNTTVNPASLSPALTPIPENDEEDEPATAATPLADAGAMDEDASPDATQHPAAMLCEDLQCRSAEALPSWLTASQQGLPAAMALLLSLQVLLVSTTSMLSLCQRPLMQIAMSLRAGFSLPPTRPILNTIIWLVTTPQPSTSRRRARPSPTSSTSTTSSSTRISPALLPLPLQPPIRSSSSSNRNSNSNSIPTASYSPSRRSSTTLRLKSLRQILTCSPSLARPLTDATMEVLRLVSTEGHDVTGVQEGADGAENAVADERLSQSLRLKQQQRPGVGDEQITTTWKMNGTKLPSREVLLTLLWAIKVEERRMRIRQERSILSGLGQRTKIDSCTPTSLGDDCSNTYVLKVSSAKRKFEHSRSPDVIDLKRRRFG